MQAVVDFTGFRLHDHIAQFTQKTSLARCKPQKRLKRSPGTYRFPSSAHAGGGEGWAHYAILGGTFAAQRLSVKDLSNL
jgi:hypothetical protein